MQGSLFQKPHGLVVTLTRTGLLIKQLKAIINFITKPKVFRKFPEGIYFGRIDVVLEGNNLDVSAAMVLRVRAENLIYRSFYFNFGAIGERKAYPDKESGSPFVVGLTVIGPLTYGESEIWAWLRRRSDV